ncbi:phosphatase PAP2 family protein [Neorhodopirellula pilleata]|uniref:Phosphatidylglycerophosphatase B n=1 Tax=Neorhodopirellula pilleata TaxID=2714738 RepID=A0A5C6AT03_9BACT|nr:phosphatase PAP2 family protein [Neorhodopirellula pilleata]TWU03183.1 phosphatidylglycerophosphatase B [Neorhodopirellula pilleata]
MQSLRPIYRWIVSHELATIILLAVIGAGTWGFVSIADEVFEGDTHRLDESILLSMRTPGDTSDPIGPNWFEEAGRDVTALGSVAALTLFTASFGGYLFVKKQPWVAVFVVVSIAAGTGVSTALKSGFDRPRPDLVPHETQIYTKSFPSGHSAMSSLVYLTLGAVMARAERDRRTKAFLMMVPIFLAILIGVSRVYMGVHWPTDVLAGWLFGITWAAASWLVFRYIQRRYALPVDAEDPRA